MGKGYIYFKDFKIIFGLDMMKLRFKINDFMFENAWL